MHSTSSLGETNFDFFFQFNSFDFKKINSHAGVRSDLFKRPLESALITDFFGGVAQVEVTPPQQGTALPPSNPSTPASQPDQKLRRAASNVPATPRLTSLLDGWREMRTWGSVAVIGVLVGWVSLKR